MTTEPEETQKLAELLEAADGLLARVELKLQRESYAVHDVYRTRAEELRLEADRLESLDRAIRRLRDAVAAARPVVVEAALAAGATVVSHGQGGGGGSGR